MMFSFVFVNWD